MKKTYSHAMRKYMSVALIGAGLLILYALVTMIFNIDKRLAGCTGIACSFILGAYVIYIAKARKKAIVEYLQRITGDDADLSESLINNVPLPMVLCSVDGSIRWYNDRFASVFGGGDFEHDSLEKYFTALKWSDVLKFPKGKEINQEIGKRIYSVCWCLIKDNVAPNKIGEHYSVFFYMKDITMERVLLKNYTNERVDVASVNIDNFDELFQKMDDEEAEAVASKIRSAIVTWSRIGNAVLKKTDRDKYFVAFEHQYLKKFVDDGFTIIDNVMKIAEDVKFPISVSIGIGTGGSFSDNEVSARNALDLALGRGGGQVCIKYNTEYKFYGGRNIEYERSTRVKARSVATAFADLIKNSDKVIFMGHKTADYDCFGTAIGLQRAVRELGSRPYIIHEHISPAIDIMYNELRNVEEYNGMFIDEIDALDEITPDTLVVVLDTHRKSMVPSQKILECAGKVVVIDHHRRSTEFISPCSLVYHEPYASSTCEMATELLEYMNIGNALTKLEAQCLYTGILMDTKNFMLKTGVRTFEAASYLRKLGLDTAAVRKMFSNRIEDYTKKAEIVSQSEFISDEVAISKTYNLQPNTRILASQAADDMLNLENVKASVVVFPTENGVGYCARSLGTVNVQLIMEKLGGGGHLTVAGATLENIDIDAGVMEAKRVVKEYLNERKI